MDSKQLEAQVNQYSKDKQEGKKKSKKSGFKYFLNISFVLIATGLSIFLSIKDDAKEIWSRITDTNNSHAVWWIAVVGVLALMILIRSLILYCFARLYSSDYKFHQAIAVDQIGQFYNAVTPGASGGEIMQAYTYKKQGIPVSSAVSILAMSSIIFQTILIIYGLLSFIIKYDFISSLGSIVTGLKFNDTPLNIPIWPLTIFGFMLNVGVILIVLLMGYWHPFHNFVMGPIISLLTKIKIVKDPEKVRENLRIQVENFKIEFRRLFTNVRFTILIAVFYVLYMMAKFSMPYFVGLALGNESQVASFWDCIFLSNYHQMVTGLIPVPGSAGVSELFFYQIFVNPTNPELGFFYVSGENARVASENLCKSALLIWRFVTFTFPVFVAGIVSAFYRSPTDESVEHRNGVPNRETFVSLQSQTLVQRRNEVDAIVETKTLSRSAIRERLNSMKNEKPSKKNKATKKEDYYDDFDAVSIKDEDEN